MHSDPATYKCYKCGTDIVDHVYQVQRRRIRPLKVGDVDNPPDTVDSSHAGVILGPEYDPYCPPCFTDLPSIKELIAANKAKLSERKDDENS